MRQKSMFGSQEGDNYYARNRDKLFASEKAPDEDPIVQSIAQLKLEPKNILEVGCSNGWRLNILTNIYKSKCWGIDPSGKAIQQGRYDFPCLVLDKATADNLPYENCMFDMIIFGFCLYLCDRSDLFKIAYEADRVLIQRGHIIIYDFHPSFPYKNQYTHYEGLYSYKMNYSKMFSWNPEYLLKYHNVFPHPPLEDGTTDDYVSVLILQKNSEWAYPDNPWRNE